MSEIRTIQGFLAEVRRELTGKDPALIQDALYDVDEFMRGEQASSAGIDEAELVDRAVKKYGSPAEIAEAYGEMEMNVRQAMRSPSPMVDGSIFARVFGVLADPHAYGALFFMLLSLATGILYFTWAVAGVAMTFGFAILIIGVPFFLLFVASLRALALAEGRVVEALLGIRMPRRPLPAEVEGGLLERVLYWLKDRHTWTTLLYLALKLPLGILSFVFAIILLATALTLLVAPLAQLFFSFPLFQVFDYRVFIAWWLFPLLWLAALVDLVILLHGAKLFGRLQGQMAKTMLVASAS